MGLGNIKHIFQKLIQEGNMSSALSKWDEYVRGEVKASIQRCFNLMPKKKSYVVIDVGANTGVFTEELLKRINIEKALLFEPVPAYVEWGKKKFVQSPEVQVMNYALSDKDEDKILYFSNQNLGWNTFIKAKVDGENRNNELSVKCKSFDKLNEEKLHLNRIDLIKIDTEGFEYKVLRGMIETLRGLKEKPLIVCEIGWGENNPHIHELRMILEEIRSMGYNIPRIDFSKTQDVFFMPSENVYS